MSVRVVPGGVVHELPRDLRDELIAHPVALAISLSAPSVTSNLRKTIF